MPLDPQIEKIIAEDKQLGLAPYHRLSPSQARKRMLALSPPADPQRSAKQVADLKIPGPEGKTAIRLYYPEGDSPFPVVLYFHGGGWVMGGLDTHHAVCHALSHASGCLVASVDYRLAPEHKYPAAVEDAYASTCWVAEHADSIRADPTRIAVMGESAGATLAAVAAMMIRDRGGPPLRLQVLVYPVTSRDLNTASHIRYAEGFMLTGEMMQWFWDQYLGDESEADHPYVSPLRAENLAQLPPALVLTAQYDPLCDEGEAYALRLMAAGTKVAYRCYEGMIHGFFRMTARIDGAQKALQEAADTIRSAFHRS